jgi:hypothetical protein
MTRARFQPVRDPDGRRWFIVILLSLFGLAFLFSLIGLFFFWAMQFAD